MSDVSDWQREVTVFARSLLAEDQSYRCGMRDGYPREDITDPFEQT